MTSRFPHFVFLTILLLTIFIYFPSLHGGFLFDDLSNLQEMRQYGDMGHWENAKKFVTHGIAGPTGRPISLLTFVPQASSILAGDAFPLKAVNLIIHLICGLLLYWVIQLLLKAYGYRDDKKIIWISLLATSFWLLHPLFVSTTAYVIQRMTQLSLLFSLVAMVMYFRGRSLLTVYPVKAYLIMTLSIAFGTILATFSKENGALLPLLIFIIEFCNPNKNNKPTLYWRVTFLWLPSLAIAVMLARYIDFSADPWANRNFNQIERLLTESRVVVDYLEQLFIPRIEGYGFFQDGFLISKSLLSPPSTLFSILFLLILFIGSLLARKKYPLVSLAILFFFAAHLMESTFIGLELYFEHRNYVAAIFLFLPIAAGLYALSQKIKLSLVLLISVLIISLLAGMTWQRAVLWSDTTKLQLYWAQNSPNSPRAQSMIATILVQDGRYKEANNIIEKALQKRPESGLLVLQLLSQKIQEGSESRKDFIQARQSIILQRADIQAAIGIRDLIFYALNQPKVIEQYGNELIGILDAMLANPSYLKIKDFQRYAIYLQGRILTMQKKPELAYQHYSRSLALSGDVADGMNMVIALGNAGYLQYALKLLDQTEAAYHKQPLDSLKQSQAYYDESIRKTRHDMQVDLHAELGKVTS